MLDEIKLVRGVFRAKGIVAMLLVRANKRSPLYPLFSDKSFRFIQIGALWQDMELPILKARELRGVWVTSWLRMRRPRSATWKSGRTPLTQRPLMKWSRSAVLVIAAFMMGWRRVVDSVGHRKEVCTLYALHL